MSKLVFLIHLQVIRHSLYTHFLCLWTTTLFFYLENVFTLQVFLTSGFPAEPSRFITAKNSSYGRVPQSPRLLPLLPRTDKGHPRNHYSVDDVGAAWANEKNREISLMAIQMFLPHQFTPGSQVCISVSVPPQDVQHQLGTDRCGMGKAQICRKWLGPSTILMALAPTSGTLPKVIRF